MKLLNNASLIQYKKIAGQLTSAASSLANAYASSLVQPSELQISFFAYSIIKNLSSFSDLLNYSSKETLQDLKDSLLTHITRHINNWKQHEQSSSLIDDFNITNQKLIKKTDVKINQQQEQLLNYEEIILREAIIDFLQNNISLFKEQNYNQKAINKLLSLTITLNVNYESLKFKLQLADNLSFYKELWQLEFDNINNFLIELYGSNFEKIKQINIENTENGLAKIGEYFINNNILQQISDENIINIYDRNKNSDFENVAINPILQDIHYEAQFRYSYNRLSDSGYELLKRFQSYDTILHQIENSEFALVETFLLRNENFNHEILMAIAKHSDNIKAVGGARNSSLSRIINHVSAGLEQHGRIHDSRSHTNIASIRAKLASSLEPQILKRYIELDKFTVNRLKNKYINLYENIKILGEGKTDNKSFLNQIIIRRLAQDYYVANMSNSMSRLRAMSLERTQIIKDLSNINFASLFGSEKTNNFTTLNFRKQIINSNIKNSEEYIDNIIGIIVKNCSASQLEELYKPIINKKLSQIEQKIKYQIKAEIKARTSLSKIIYSLFAGKKNEYRKLWQLKQNYQQLNSDDIKSFEKKTQNQEEII